MKISIIAVLVITSLTVAFLCASCNQSVQVAKVSPSPVNSTKTNIPSLFTDDWTRDQATLRQMGQSIHMGINEYRFLNQPVPEKLLAAQQAVDEASRALKELEEERQNTITGINNYKVLVQPVPENLTDHLRRIEDQRQVILIRYGLAD